MSPAKSAEKVVQDIRRKTRRRFSVEEKIRIVLGGLQQNSLHTTHPLGPLIRQWQGCTLRQLSLCLIHDWRHCPLLVRRGAFSDDMAEEAHRGAA